MEIHRILNPPRDAHAYSAAGSGATPGSSLAHDPYGAWLGMLYAWLGALAPDVGALLASHLLSPAQDDHARRLLSALSAPMPPVLGPRAADQRLAAVLDAGNAFFRQGGFLRMPDAVRARYTTLATRFADGAGLRERLGELMARWPGAWEEHA